jgi:PRTRC genetic system protein C
MAEKTTLPRVFMFNGQRLELPDKSMTNEAVKKHHASHFPQLTNASINVEEKDGKQIVTFKAAVGTKG